MRHKKSKTTWERPTTTTTTLRSIAWRSDPTHLRIIFTPLDAYILLAHILCTNILSTIQLYLHLRSQLRQWRLRLRYDRLVKPHYRRLIFSFHSSPRSFWGAPVAQYFKLGSWSKPEAESLDIRVVNIEAIIYDKNWLTCLTEYDKWTWYETGAKPVEGEAGRFLYYREWMITPGTSASYAVAPTTSPKAIKVDSVGEEH
jgi:hypothetical protein